MESVPVDVYKRQVFMNSKVKQVLREGASVADIAAGLSYSVVKNCLYKVLQLKDTEILGDHIVVQGGTMRNDSIVRSLEKLTGKQTSVSYTHLDVYKRQESDEKSSLSVSKQMNNFTSNI